MEDGCCFGEDGMTMGDEVERPVRGRNERRDVFNVGGSSSGKPKLNSIAFLGF